MRTKLTLFFLVILSQSACAQPPVVDLSCENTEVDMSPLQEMEGVLAGENNHGIRSILLWKDDCMAYENYWGKYHAHSTHDLRSATKSITSLLVGIAIEQGHLKLDDPVFPILRSQYPEHKHTSPEKDAITVRHLLTMSSGLACNDRDKKSPGQEDRMYKKRDWLQHFTDLPMDGLAGDSSIYCTGGVVALGRLIEVKSGMKIDAFAEQFLFGPLGITDYTWARFDGKEGFDTGGHIDFRPRDMIKIGRLVLQKGKWEGKQIVSEAWIQESTDLQTRIDGGRPYGYLWWFAGVKSDQNTYKMVFASGNGGQYIFIIPELDCVVVFTAGNYNSPKAGRPFALLNQYIFPALPEF
ncbi:MAG: serine hydrolase [Bacteroidota bacterium]